MAVSLNDIRKTTNPQKRKAAPQSDTGLLKKILSYEIGGNKLKDSFKESFYGELALLLEAGMNVKSGLDLLAGQQKKEKHKALLASIIDKLTRGARFSEVLRDEGKFSAYEHFSIRIGEETGNLVEILQRLSSFYGQKIQQRRSLTGALTYPAIVLLTALLAVTFMLTYMVPLFKDIFGRMGGELPGLTRMIISLSEGFSSGLIVVVFMLIAFMGAHYALLQNERYRKLRYDILLRIPLIGPMALKTYTLRMIQSMSLLITSRVPLTEALELSSRMVRFYPISRSLDLIRKKILQGSGLYEGMASFPIYDQRLVALVKVGEETNQLGLIFNKLSAQMEEELQHRARVLGNTLEPVIVIFLGVLVAIILIAMYMPMFELSTSFG